MLNIETAVYRPWRVSPCYEQMQWVLKTHTDTDGAQLYLHFPSKEELQRWVDNRNAEEASMKRRADAEAAFLAEVVEALVDEGKAPHVARNLTNTPPS